MDAGNAWSRGRWSSRCVQVLRAYCILQLSVLDFSNFVTDWENIILRLKNDFIHSLGIMPLNFLFCLSYALFKGLLSSFPAVLAMQTLDFLSL